MHAHNESNGNFFLLIKKIKIKITFFIIHKHHPNFLFEYFFGKRNIFFIMGKSVFSALKLHAF